jgi:hypothetical protein
MLDHPADLLPGVRAQQAFDSLQVFKARTLMERMLGPGGDQVPRLAPNPVTCRELQAQILRPDELLLDYYLGEEESILFTISRRDCRGIRMPSREMIEEIISLYYRTVSKPPETETFEGASKVLRGSGDRIGELLLGTVLGSDEHTRSLIVIPDGIINLVGFHGLLESFGGRQSEADRSARGGAQGEAHGGQHSDRAIAVQVAPSATIFAELRRRESHGSKEPRSVGRILALHGGWNANGERLDAAIAEVVELDRRFDGVMREVAFGLASPEDSSTAESRSDAVPHALDRFDILHLAAHATADDQHPWRSRIHLDGGAESSTQRDLLAFEIAGCRLSAKLAVLSGCRSAGGRILSGEGVQGLASAFLTAGVPTVIATLWPVDDRTTSRMIHHFYDGLAQGRTIASALAEAQRTIRADPKRAHPFYWAGFVLVGDGDSRLHLTTRRTVPRYLTPVLLSIVGILAIASPRLLRRSRKGNL